MIRVAKVPTVDNTAGKTFEVSLVMAPVKETVAGNTLKVDFITTPEKESALFNDFLTKMNEEVALPGGELYPGCEIPG